MSISLLETMMFWCSGVSRCPGWQWPWRSTKPKPVKPPKRRGPKQPCPSFRPTRPERRPGKRWRKTGKELVSCKLVSKGILIPCHVSHIGLSMTSSMPTSKTALNWANVCSTNYDSFLNWAFSSPNMVWTVQTLLRSQLAGNEMQASARTCGRGAAGSMIENVG